MNVRSLKKLCKGCNRLLPIDEFVPDPETLALSPICVTCTAGDPKEGDALESPIKYTVTPDENEQFHDDEK